MRRTISMKITSVKSTRDLKKRDLKRQRWNWMPICCSLIYLAFRNLWMTKPRVFIPSTKSMIRFKNRSVVNPSRLKLSCFKIAIFTKESYSVAWWVKSWHPASTRLFRANTKKRMQILNTLKIFKGKFSLKNVSGSVSHKKRLKRLDAKKWDQASGKKRKVTLY